MIMPDRREEVHRIWLQRDNPALLSEDAFAGFTRLVAACFAFGVPAWGIDGDPLWGVRRNSTGTVSKDVLRYGDVGAVDIASGAGQEGWHFQWLTYGPDSDRFGVGRKPASRADLPQLPPAQLPPPPVTSESDAILDHALNDYSWYIHHVAGIDQAIVDRYLDIQGKSPTVGTLGHLHWRMAQEHDRWAQEFGAPLTLRKLLQDALPKTIALGEAPSLFTLHGEHGNFLYPNHLYFPPHCWVDDERALRKLLAWNKEQGYTLILAMLEQDDWGPSKGTPDWTEHTAPRVRTGDAYDAYGWTRDLDELIRRITIARQEYGLEVVLSLWDQQRLDTDFEYALANTRRVVQALDSHVCAFFNGWEIDEVLTLEQQHALNIAVARWATKPSGPHFAGTVNNTYWNDDNSTVLWHQQNRDLGSNDLAEEMRRTIRNNSVTVIAFEHSAGVRHSSYTHEASQVRAQANLDAGAFASLNG